jgi:hypothetical protein
MPIDYSLGNPTNQLDVMGSYQRGVDSANSSMNNTLSRMEMLQKIGQRNALMELTQKYGNDPAAFYEHAAQVDPAYAEKAIQYQQHMQDRQIKQQALQQAAEQNANSQFASAPKGDISSQMLPVVQRLRDAGMNDEQVANYFNKFNGAQNQAGIQQVATSSLPIADQKALRVNEWSEPYKINGAMVQRNSATGEIKTAVTRESPGFFMQATPEDQAIIGEAIASGKLDPNRVNSRNAKLLASTLKQTPGINLAGKSTEINSARQSDVAFSKGKEGQAVRSFNVGLAHLDTLGGLADALHNGDIQMSNKIANAYAAQTGNPAPTNFEGAKKIVADEIVKAIVGAGGGVADREEAAKTISSANSPEQLRGVINTYKELMVGQLGGLDKQYQAGTGKTDFQERFLSDNARNLYSNHQTKSNQQATPKSTQGSPSVHDAADAILNRKSVGKQGAIPNQNKVAMSFSNSPRG